MTTFEVLKGFIIVHVGTMDPSQPQNKTFKTLGELMDPFPHLGNPFQTMGELVGSVQSQQLGTHLHLTFPGLSC